MSTHHLNLYGVLSETKRIINAHSRHFLALSVQFLLPLSFSLVVYPSLARSPSIISRYHQPLFYFSSPEPDLTSIGEPHKLLPILYLLFVLLLSLCGTASITYSTFHGFYGRPVNFVSSLKSIFYSFFPLVSTLSIALICTGLISFALGGFTMLVFNGLVLFGVEVDHNNAYFMWVVVLITAVLVGLLVFLNVELYLWNVVVIVESQWGFAALKRSSYLVKGVRIVAFGLIMLFGLLIGFLGMLCANLVPHKTGIRGGWASLAFISQTVIYTGFMTILMLYNVAANSVLYMYCKALHGELEFEIPEEFARE